MTTDVLAGFNSAGTQFVMRANSAVLRSVIEISTLDRRAPLGLRNLSSFGANGFYVDDTTISPVGTDRYSINGLVLLAVVDAERGIAGGAMFNVTMAAERVGTRRVVPYATFRYQR